jgi:cytoskeleton protein RodZ
VEAVPERLGGPPERKSPSNAEAATPPAVAETPAAAEPPKPEIKAEAPPALATAPAAAPAVPTPPPVAAAPQPAAPTPPAPAAAASEPQVAALSASPAPSTAAPASSETRPAATPKQYGDTESPRILIKATADSWVQIREPGGSIVFSRILRTGDTYGVSSRPGQTLTTGSAGVLEFIVDGKKAPTIGRPGFTQHDVPLDAARLLAGTAVIETRPAARPQRPASSPVAAPSAAPAAEPLPSAPAQQGSDG